MATPITVADAAVAVGADLKPFDAALAKAEHSGTASSSRLAAAIKADMGGALKVAGAGLLAVTGIALKGGLDLSNAMAKYRAETGATDAEAKEAQKTLVGLYKTNIDGFDKLAAVLAVVHNDMGLVGEDARKAAQLVLDFAHATGVDAVQAARSLDDATDAYNLSAGQQVDLLDKLVASHQKYGGEIGPELQLLIDLAPALKAANLSYDEGIGLLNLFAKAGVDAAKAPVALQRALSKVKSPAELKALIADIAATKDPLERAQKASELFGAKAGPQLALALAQGSGALDEYTPKTADAAGATEKAAEAAKTLGDKLKIAFHSLTGEADNLVAGIEPVVATLAYLPKAAGTLSAALGLLVLRNKEATLGMIASAFATKAQALAYVILRPSLWATALGVAALSIAHGAYAVASGLATIATNALGVAMRLLPIFAVIALVVLLYEAWEHNFGGIRDIVGAVVGFIVDHLAFLFPVLEAVGKAVGAVFGFIGEVIGNVAGAVDHALNDANRAADAAVTQTTRIVSDHLRSEHDNWYDAASHAATGIAEAIAQRKDDAASAARVVARGVPSVIEIEGRLWAEETRRAATSIGREIRNEGPEVHRATGNMMLAGAQGIRDKRSAIDGAIEQLKTDIKNRMGRTKEIGHDFGLLIGKEVAHGLHSSDPVVKSEAEGIRNLIEARLLELGVKMSDLGKAGQQKLKEGLHSKDPEVKAQAERTKSLIDEALKKPPAKSPGDVIGDQLNRDLGTKGTPLGKTAYQLGRTIATNIIAGVKGTGYVAPSGGTAPKPSSGGAPRAYDVGTTYVPHDMLALIHKGEIIVPPGLSDQIRAGAANLGGGGDTFQTTLVMPDARNVNPLDVLERASRLQRWGQLNPRPASG